MLEPCELIAKDSQVADRCMQKLATWLAIPVNHWPLHKFNSVLFLKSPSSKLDTRQWTPAGTAPSD